jgi:hypothetical protein
LDLSFPAPVDYVCEYWYQANSRLQNIKLRSFFFQEAVIKREWVSELRAVGGVFYAGVTDRERITTSKWGWKIQP